MIEALALAGFLCQVPKRCEVRHVTCDEVKVRVAKTVETRQRCYLTFEVMRGRGLRAKSKAVSLVHFTP
jgi:hypothetical protein